MGHDSSIDKEKEWQLKVKEMDRLCQLHLEIPYSAARVAGHLLLIKLAPFSNEMNKEKSSLPLKGSSGIYFSTDHIKKDEMIRGLVVAMGRYAYEDGIATKWTEGPLCELGDIICASTQEVWKTTLNGYDIATLRDTSVSVVTNKPHLYGNNIYNKSSKFSNRDSSIIYKRKDFLELGLECTDPQIIFMDDLENEDAK